MRLPAYDTRLDLLFPKHKTLKTTWAGVPAFQDLGIRLRWNRYSGSSTDSSTVRTSINPYLTPKCAGLKNSPGFTSDSDLRLKTTITHFQLRTRGEERSLSAVIILQGYHCCSQLVCASLWQQPLCMVTRRLTIRTRTRPLLFIPIHVL